MIALFAASAVYLLAGQAAITAPTSAYKDCLKQASNRAKSEKVAAAAYDAYARTACSAEIAALRNALIAFEVKNGTKRMDAAKDADLTVDDYLASSADSYQFATADAAAAAKASAPAAVTPAAQATPASAPQPPR